MGLKKFSPEIKVKIEFHITKIMASPLDKARQNPTSMKAKILNVARTIFGEYGYDGTTTRMIAGQVGIDISTLYYHWGEKQDLYEAVISDINDQIFAKLKDIEKQAKNKSLAKRLDIAIEAFSDYLFDHPEICNLIIYRYFGKTKHEAHFCIKEPEYISNIAVAMGLALDKNNISIQAKAMILVMWNSIFTLISGENFFRPMLNIERDPYKDVIKQSLKSILIPAFAKEKPVLEKNND